MSEKFINIGETRIKKSNIKTFGIGTKKESGDGPIGVPIGLFQGKGFKKSISESFLGIEKRYLYVTTYQNDNYTFLEDEIDIDAAIRNLENI